MSTRSVTFIHKKCVNLPTGEYVCKLYRHCDGYVEWWLGDELVEAFKKVAGENTKLSDYDIYNAIKLIDWYEYTQWVHGDAEYVYHIYDKDDNGHITITYQTGFDEESILEEEEHEIWDSETNGNNELKKKLVKYFDDNKVIVPSCEFNKELCTYIQNACDMCGLWLNLYYVDEGDTYRVLLIKGKVVLDDDLYWGGSMDLADKLIAASNLNSNK